MKTGKTKLEIGRWYTYSDEFLETAQKNVPEKLWKRYCRPKQVIKIEEKGEGNPGLPAVEVRHWGKEYFILKHIRLATEEEIRKEKLKLIFELKP